jgi:hypothetical protein
MCVIKREPIRLYLIKYHFQTGINSAIPNKIPFSDGKQFGTGVEAREPIRYQPGLNIFKLNESREAPKMAKLCPFCLALPPAMPYW